MNQKYQQNMNHANVNVNSIVENVTRIKIGITINVCASVKIKRNSLCVRERLYLESCYK